MTVSKDLFVFKLYDKVLLICTEKCCDIINFFNFVLVLVICLFYDGNKLFHFYMM